MPGRYSMMRDGSRSRPLDGAFLEGHDVGDEAPGCRVLPVLTQRRRALVPGGKSTPRITIELVQEFAQKGNADTDVPRSGSLNRSTDEDPLNICPGDGKDRTACAVRPPK